MERLPMDALRGLWKEQGFWGPWRGQLRSGYAPDDVYVEFGLMPAQDECDYRIVLDHDVTVLLCRRQAGASYVIRPDDRRGGQEEVSGTPPRHTLFVSDADYSQFLHDAADIYRQYQDDDRGSFWSIPQKWFGDAALVKFLVDRIVLTDDYRNRVRTRLGWFWP